MIQMKNCLEADESITGNEMITRERIKGVDRVCNNLKTFFNEDPWQYLEDSAGIVYIDTTESLLVANIHDGNPEPKNMIEAKHT